MADSELLMSRRVVLLVCLHALKRCIQLSNSNATCLVRTQHLCTIRHCAGIQSRHTSCYLNRFYTNPELRQDALWFRRWQALVSLCLKDGKMTATQK